MFLKVNLKSLSLGAPILNAPPGDWLNFDRPSGTVSMSKWLMNGFHPYFFAMIVSMSKWLMNGFHPYFLRWSSISLPHRPDSRFSSRLLTCLFCCLFCLYASASGHAQRRRRTELQLLQIDYDKLWPCRHLRAKIVSYDHQIRHVPHGLTHWVLQHSRGRAAGIGSCMSSWMNIAIKWLPKYVK